MQSYKLSILIPHLKSYDPYLSRLRSVLDPQLTDDIQVITFTDYGEMSIGFKRNWLLNKAGGEYLCFIDSDDLVSENYIELISEGIAKGVDCCSLTGEITFDGLHPKRFIHSIKYKKWYEDSRPINHPTRASSDVANYYRPPNHLNCIRSYVAKQFKFPDINHSEDKDWSMQIQRSGLLKKEHWIEETIYHYLYRSKK